MQRTEKAALNSELLFIMYLTFPSEDMIMISHDKLGVSQHTYVYSVV